MTKKVKTDKQRGRAGKAQSRKPPRAQESMLAPSRLVAEQVMRDLHKVLEGREFNGVEEANAFLETLAGPGLQQALHGAAPRSQQEEAQALAHRAMDAPTRRQARNLAKQALAKDPDCVDALVVLSETDARTPEELIAGLQTAVATGERSLGAEYFVENKGDFWGLLETRPYMRARLDLAQLLLGLGRVREAAGHFEALLELNPNDNQGVRDILLGCYLAAGDLRGASGLLNSYAEDSSAVFAWGRTLERFLSSDLEAAERALKQARKQNQFVELYLTGKRPPPKDMPDAYSRGSEEEAVICMVMLAVAWAEHPAAVSWLWKQVGFRPAPGQVPQGKLF